MTDSIQVIDVLIVVDTETVLAKYGAGGSVGHPYSVDERLIWAVAKKDSVVFANATGELKLRAQTEDIIRWRATGLSLNSEDSVILYAFAVKKQSGPGLIRKPRANLVELKTPLPQENDPAKPAMQTVQDYFWQTTVQRSGHEIYTFNFMIVHRDGTVRGHFTWDPTITISE